MGKSKILLDLICIKTGLLIKNKNDCKKISKLISDKKLGYLSESTLYRFFLHPSNNYKPYKNTLHILAKFCDFGSWEEFQYYCNAKELHKNANFLTITLNKIINQFIVDENFDGLIIIFKSIENESYKTKEFVGLIVLKAFQDVMTFDKFVKEYGSNLFVRKILIESLFDPKYRISGYVDALHNYLINTNVNSKDYLQDIVFGNTVLFRYYYLNKDLEYLDIGNLLYNSKLIESEIDSIHLFPKSRFYAYKIWFLNSLKIPQQQKVIQYKELINWFINQIEKATTIIDLNIIYQTIVEVLDNLDLEDLQKKTTSIYLNKLKKIESNFEEYERYHNANGIMNFKEF